jgi:hypothetical protein
MPKLSLKFGRSTSNDQPKQSATLRYPVPRLTPTVEISHISPTVTARCDDMYFPRQMPSLKFLLSVRPTPSTHEH